MLGRVKALEHGHKRDVPVDDTFCQHGMPRCQLQHTRIQWLTAHTVVKMSLLLSAMSLTCTMQASGKLVSATDMAWAQA